MKSFWNIICFNIGIYDIRMEKGNYLGDLLIIMSHSSDIPPPLPGWNIIFVTVNLELILIKTTLWLLLKSFANI